MEHDVSAVFSWSEQDYTAAARGARMIQHPGNDSVVMRAGFLFTSHFVIVMCLFVIGFSLAERQGKNGPIPGAALALNVALVLVAAYALFTRWYGLRWILRREFRSSLFHDLKVNYLFTPTQIETTSRLVQSKRAWRVIRQVVEFRDGFILVSGGEAEWIPKNAFGEPFDAERFSDLARNVSQSYKVIDRRAFLPERSRVKHNLKSEM